jgi:hypothetical protein
VQAATAAEYLSTRRERLPVRKHDPVFTGRLGTIGTELGQGEPIMIGAVPAEQSDTRAQIRLAMSWLHQLPALDYALLGIGRKALDPIIHRGCGPQSSVR